MATTDSKMTQSSELVHGRISRPISFKVAAGLAVYVRIRLLYFLNARWNSLEAIKFPASDDFLNVSLYKHTPYDGV